MAISWKSRSGPRESSKGAFSDTTSRRLLLVPFAVLPDGFDVQPDPEGPSINHVRSSETEHDCKHDCGSVQVGGLGILFVVAIYLIGTCSLQKLIIICCVPPLPPKHDDSVWPSPQAPALAFSKTGGCQGGPSAILGWWLATTLAGASSRNVPKWKPTHDTAMQQNSLGLSQQSECRMMQVTYYFLLIYTVAGIAIILFIGSRTIIVQVK